MSQVYTTEVNIKIKKGQEEMLLEDIKSYIKTAFINEETLNELLKTTNIEDIIKGIFCGKPYENCLDSFSKKDNEITMCASFNASYGWESIMQESKKIICKYCENDFNNIEIYIW